MATTQLLNALKGKLPSKLFLALLCAALLSGCGIVASQKRSELLSRTRPEDWGVLDSNHEAVARDFILQMLRDPESARIRLTKTERLVSGGLEPFLSWRTWYMVNAKNSFGGYTGEKPFAFKYRCPVGEKCQIIDYAIPDDSRIGQVTWQR